MSDVESGVRSRLYLGVVRVIIPDTRGNVSAIDANALGLGWDKGPFLGWKSGSWIEADPSKCQLLIIIRSPAQAANAAAVLQAFEGQNPCIVNYTRASSR